MRSAGYGILWPTHSSWGFSCLVAEAHSSCQARRPLMVNRIQRRPFCQVQHFRRRLAQSSALPITRLLPVADVDAAMAAEGFSFRERVFTPRINIWMFLGQGLRHDQSLRQRLPRLV